MQDLFLFYHNPARMKSNSFVHTMNGGDCMCHRYKNRDRYGDGDVPEVDTKARDKDRYQDVEPLPESTRERRDGPGGE